MRHADFEKIYKELIKIIEDKYNIEIQTTISKK